MSTVLITGTSGFIGQALAARLKVDHEVICLSRAATPVEGVERIQGDFSVPVVLSQLDHLQIDTLVHLAAVTGGCTEADGIRVNAGGTHGLMRYLVDRGCSKFVLASSIALIGIQSRLFRPLQVPIPDEHPCLDRDGYGLSKYLMEEVTRYLSRQNPEMDIINIRLAAIVNEEAQLDPVCAGDTLSEWALASLSRMYLSDAVDCFAKAAEAPHKAGLRIMNAVAASACTRDTVPEVLKAWYGADAEGLDFSHYERPGHERDPVYDIRRIEAEIGFVPLKATI